MLDKLLLSKRTLVSNILIRNYAATTSPVVEPKQKKGLSYYLDFFNDTKPLDQSGTILANIGKKLHHDPLPSLPKDFKEFPERDLVNFPYPEMQMYPAKNRFILIPDSWCRAIEKVTGTSGPYMTIFTIAAFFVNKEIFCFDENGVPILYIFIPMYLFLKHCFGYKIEKNYYEWYKNQMNERKDFIKSELKEAVDFRKFSKEQSDSFKATQENFPTILRENLALQLESAYRKNAEYAWIELKRRLDYLKEVQETKERFAKEVYLKTITEGVRKMIEMNEGNIREKYMDQCIENLKLLTK
uniref:ATP synthase subunit b n=1 Tax=Meloidogyne javanica TaxID=6303 RepID=A0A915MK63_MELJA